ncbi:MAG TPA: hypothetical protein VHB77_16950, partial [Planctomycetaceae bacterium]|nr:hypothetical protein [Planctomycetaceae bacterium]
MSQLPERDELIERLAAEDTSSRVEGADPTLIEFKAELETLESQIRQPEPPDPFADESACGQLVEKVAEMGRDLSTDTRAELERQEVAAEAPALGMLGQYQLLAKLGEGGMGA